MSRMLRYLIAAVIGGALGALLVLLSLDLVFVFIDESDDIGDGSYGLGKALAYILLSAPYRAYQMLPMATLIGSLMTLGGLAARNELIAMRAAGFSSLAMVRAVAVGGLILALTAAAAGEWLVPPAESLAHELRNTALNKPVRSGTGFWLRDGDRFVRVARAISDQRLEGVQIFQLGESQRLGGVTAAAAANYAGDAWMLEGVTDTRFTEQGVQVERLESLVWELELEPRVLDAVVVDPQTLPLRELYHYVDFLDRSGLESESYALAFWVKLATPLATIAMLLLTVPLVFGQVRSASVGERIFVGVLIGLVFFLGNRLLNHAGLIYGLPPAVSALLPTAVVFAVATVAILRFR